MYSTSSSVAFATIGSLHACGFLLSTASCSQHVLRGEESIAELCRREGIVQNLYYRWSNDLVKELRREASALKEVVAELTLENRLLKKSMIADGEDEG